MKEGIYHARARELELQGEVLLVDARQDVVFDPCPGYLVVMTAGDSVLDNTVRISEVHVDKTVVLYVEISRQYPRKESPVRMLRLDVDLPESVPFYPPPNCSHKISSP